MSTLWAWCCVEMLTRCTDAYGAEGVPAYRLPFEAETAPATPACRKMQAAVVIERRRPEFPASASRISRGRRRSQTSQQEEQLADQQAPAAGLQLPASRCYQRKHLLPPPQRSCDRCAKAEDAV
uniref:Secreted protein n=1 Tax=Macrostomum lignano TaxID=282301 RepID=A0A1I8FHF7_9PLAT